MEEEYKFNLKQVVPILMITLASGGGVKIFDQAKEIDALKAELQEKIEHIKEHADDEDDGVRSDFEKADELLLERVRRLETEMNKHHD